MSSGAYSQFNPFGTTHSTFDAKGESALDKYSVAEAHLILATRPEIAFRI
jgi:hypothetical protein